MKNTSSTTSDSNKEKQRFTYEKEGDASIAIEKLQGRLLSILEKFDKSTIIKNVLSECDIKNYDELIKVWIDNLKYIAEIILTPRSFEMYKAKYLSNKKVTLQCVGNTYGITRERVRQICDKSRRRIRYHLSSNTFSISSYRNEIILSINELSDSQLISLMIYCKQQRPWFFIEFTKVLFQNKLHTVLIERFKIAYSLYTQVSRQTQISIENKKKQTKKQVNEENRFFRNLYIFDTTKEFDEQIFDEIEVRTLNINQRIKRIAFSITCFENTKRIVTHPNLFIDEAKTVCPTFAIYTYQKNIILVNAISFSYMVTKYNLYRSRLLHTYCKSLGFNYAIIDERFNSLFDIVNTPINIEFDKRLIQMLKSKGVLFWHDIKGIKKSVNATVKEMYSSVLHHDLELYTKPFRIKLP
jgi:hypothetical protein